MKKFTAILLSAIIVCAMAVTVSAALPNLKGITKDGYTAYPLYDDAGIYTKGVTLYHHNGDKITQEELNGKIGKDWDQNVFKNAEGQSELIIWTRGGIRFCNPAHGSCEIVFTGTGIRLGTGYRNGDPNTTFANNKAKITIDGKEVEMIVKVGDKVLTSKYSGTEVKVDGEECTIVRQSDILAVVE